MNDPILQASGFENLLGLAILVLWVVGKILTARSEKNPAPKRRPGAPWPTGAAPAPEPAPAPRGPDLSPEEKLRRFLAQLSGEEILPAPVEIEIEEAPVFAPPPPPPPPPPPRPPPPRRRASPSVRAAGEARRSGSRADPRDILRQARAAASQSSPPMTIMRQSTRSTGLPPSAMTGRILMGPRLSLAGAGAGAARGPGAAAAALTSALHSPRRVREAFLLREILSPPRAFDRKPET